MAQLPVGLAGRPVICKQLGFGLCKNAILQIYAKNTRPGWLISSAASFKPADSHQALKKPGYHKYASKKAVSLKAASKKPP
jgi:hypothetical protein